MQKTKSAGLLPEDHYKHRQLREIVLAALGMSVLVGGIMITPNFPIILSSIISLIKDFKRKDIPASKIKRVLKNLERKEIVNLEIKGEEVYVYLKNWFTPSTVKYSLRAILDLKKRKKQWKQKWFLVMFDVPEIQRNKRIYLRNFLKYIGFYPYQKSVYLFPYECEKEISLVRKIVEGTKYMSYIVAEKIDNEQAARTYFNL